MPVERYSRMARVSLQSHSWGRYVQLRSCRPESFGPRRGYRWRVHIRTSLGQSRAFCADDYPCGVRPGRGGCYPVGARRFLSHESGSMNECSGEARCRAIGRLSSRICDCDCVWLTRGVLGVLRQQHFLRALLHASLVERNRDEQSAALLLWRERRHPERSGRNLICSSPGNVE